MHLIECLTYLIARVASSQLSFDPTCLVIQGVKKAFSYADATRPTFAELPEDAKPPGDEDGVRMLRKSLYAHEMPHSSRA